jgi:hypothetical protein
MQPPLFFLVLFVTNASGIQLMNRRLQDKDEKYNFNYFIEMSWVSFPGGAAVPLSQVYSPAANIAHPTISPDSFSLDIVRHTLNRNDVFEVIHLSSILVQVAQKDMRSKLNNYQIQ